MTIPDEVWDAAVRVVLLFRPVTLPEHKDVGLILRTNVQVERDRRPPLVVPIFEPVFEPTSAAQLYAEQEARMEKRD
jgi:hypothetical protein